MRDCYSRTWYHRNYIQVLIYTMHVHIRMYTCSVPGTAICSCICSTYSCGYSWSGMSEIHNADLSYLPDLLSYNCSPRCMLVCMYIYMRYMCDMRISMSIVVFMRTCSSCHVVSYYYTCRSLGFRYGVAISMSGIEDTYSGRCVYMYIMWLMYMYVRTCMQICVCICVHACCMY